MADTILLSFSERKAKLNQAMAFLRNAIRLNDEASRLETTLKDTIGVTPEQYIVHDACLAALGAVSAAAARATAELAAINYLYQDEWEIGKIPSVATFAVDASADTLTADAGTPFANGAGGYLLANGDIVRAYPGVGTDESETVNVTACTNTVITGTTPGDFASSFTPTKIKLISKHS